MKKRILVGLGGLTLLLVACTEQEIYYKGQERPVSEVEEIIADELEVENPSMDLELDIYEDDDDSTTKTKSRSH